MLRILFLPSHIGLGHVTRDYKISTSLSSLIDLDLKIDWCTAEPAYTYLQAKGQKILDICRELISMSVIAEEYVDKKTLYRPWTLKKHLHILEKNYDILKKGISWNTYDLIIADEF